MNSRSLGRQLFRLAEQVTRQYLRDQRRHSGRPSSPSRGRATSTVASPGTVRQERHDHDRRDRDGREAGPDGAPYPGDYTGDIRNIKPVYAPEPDGEPDAGEVVWAWVPYEEDPSRGKDRPVLIIGQQGGLLLALMLTSKDHDRDARQEARAGRYWMDIGTGAWDSRRRPSEVRLNRVLRLRPESVRREGDALDREVFERVAKALASGW